MRYEYVIFLLCAALHFEHVHTRAVGIQGYLYNLAFSIQDKGAFALAQALKADEDPAVTSLNLASNFLNKYGQVTPTVISVIFMYLRFHGCIYVNYIYLSLIHI